jgi:transposase
MLKTFTYRLYPSKPQARLLESTLETCRRWYNQCLAERRDAYAPQSGMPASRVKSKLHRCPKPGRMWG